MKTLFSLFVMPVVIPVMALFCSCSGAGGEAPAEIFLNVPVTQMTIPGDVAPVEIPFTCNGDWTASSDNDWIDVRTPSGKGSLQEQVVLFVPTDNTAGSERVGLIEIVSGDCYETIMVTQVPAAANSISSFFDGIRNADFSKVYICAHRANTYTGIYEKYIPENSIPAIKKCIELGIEMVELDVRKTKDGVLVCCHDAHIRSVTNGSGNVADLTYSQICSYDMKSREKGVVTLGLKMPTLEQALLACKDKIWVNLDLAKTTISPSEVVAVIKKAGMLDQVTCYTGSDADLAKSYYRINDRLSLHLSISASGGVTSIAGTKTTPLFQISTAKYWDGTAASSSLSNSIRKQQQCSFSNLLNYDSQVMKGDMSALDAFIAAKIDFLQTDIADHPNVMNTLKEAGLR